MTIEKRNGKLTKVEILRGISLTALQTGKNHHTFSGIARRLNISPKNVLNFLNWYKKSQNINFIQTTRRGVDFIF